MTIPTEPDSVSNPYWFDDALAAGAATALVLLVEHAVFWDEPQRLSRPADYMLGTATLATGLLGWVLTNRKSDALSTWIAGATIAIMGGSTVTICYYVRRLAGKYQRAGVRGGRIYGALFGLPRQEDVLHGHYAAAEGHRHR